MNTMKQILMDSDMTKQKRYMHMYIQTNRPNIHLDKNKLRQLDTKIQTDQDRLIRARKRDA